MDRFDPFVKYADVYGDIINWEKDPMNKPQNQNKYFFSDGKTYYEQICKMLRLMSVFKEAFNQIYTNEDEISEAWENFVNNLSASVVEGSEPDVTLTWTDDSVNFEFTMVPGVPGEQGVGITSISFNSDYTMTITLSDGNSYTSMSLKGETGPQGPQGETGSGLQILDVYATLADLQSAHPTGEPGDAYQVGSAGSYTLYIWSSSQSAWVPAGSLGTVSPSVSNPLMDGTASAGSLDQYSRGDHVHPSDTSRASKEELNALIKTSQALIDQSFTYRESPAIQDGLARIDKIKGNTLAWNQLADPSNYFSSLFRATKSIEGNTVTLTDNRTSSSDNFGGASLLGTSIPAGHTVLVSFNITSLNITNFVRYTTYLRNSTGIGASSTINRTDTGIQKVILTATAEANQFAMNFYTSSATTGSTDTTVIEDIMVFDLTSMGLEITEPSEFTSFFPLSYYAYNSGSLLNFNGTGIKTTGKNLLENDNATNQNRNKFTYSSETTDEVSCLKVSSGGAFYFKMKTDFIAGQTYKLSVGDVNIGTSTHVVNFYIYSDDLWGTVILIDRILKNSDYSITFNQTYRGAVIGFFLANDSDSGTNVNVKNIMLRFDGTDNTYEPYTSSTLSLPISTYFPTGMKSAGNVYDELTESKATTRIGAVDLGTLDWFNQGSYFYNVTDIAPASGTSNWVCTAFTLKPSNVGWTEMENGMAGFGGTQFRAKYPVTSANDFKSAMSGVMLYYEIATPTETAVDLDLDFMAYEDGTEQLLPVNGSVPSTSPIIANMTYLSIDDAMEYVLEKLANVPQNTQQILESLEDDVADLQTDEGILQTNVSGLQTSVGNINTNIGQLSSTVAGHTASISDMQSDITDLNTDLGDLEDTVTDNTSRIGTLETGLSTTNGNVQSLSSQVQSIDGRVTNLESDLFKIVVKEFDYDTVAPETNFGTTTPITQEEGYRVIGVVGTEAQAGEYTSPASNIAITQCHIYYTSLGALTITIFGRNNGASSRTNVRIYAYLLCIKDIQ